MPKNPLFLIFIIISAFTVRFLGVGVADYYIDEATLIFRARQILTGESIFNPDFVNSGIAYGMVISYIHALIMLVVYKIGFILGKWPSIDEAYPALKLSARLVSVFTGTAAVYFTYLSAQKLFNVKTGLFAAIILAFSFNHVAQSQYALVDITKSFFLIIAFYFSVSLLMQRRRLIKYYFIAGIFSGLAFGMKYNFAVFAPIFTAHSLLTWKLLSIKEKNIKDYILKWFGKEIFIAGLSAVIIFTLTNPYLFINPKDFIVQLSKILQWSWDFPYGARDFDKIPNIVWYIVYMAKIGVYYPFFILILGGIIIGVLKFKQQTILLLSYPVIQLIILEIYTPRTDRYPVWWLPMLTILGGVFLSFSYNFITGQRWNKWNNKFFQKTLFIILTVLITLPVARILLFDYMITAKPDTRQEARKFFQEHPHPLYFVGDINGKFLGGKNAQLLTSHSLLLAGFNPQSSSSLNVFRYPGAYVLLTSFIYEDYQHVKQYNSDWKILNPRPAITEQFLSKYLEEGKYVTEFMKNEPQVGEYSRFGFENNFYNAVRISGGGSDVGLSFNPTVKIYKIKKTKKEIAPLDVTYYPESIAQSRFEILSPLKNTKLNSDYLDKKAIPIFILESNDNQEAMLKTSQSPFPPGNFLVKITLKIDPSQIIKQKEYGFVTFGDQKVLGNISLQKIKGKDFKQEVGYQVIELRFTLVEISKTSVELTWKSDIIANIKNIEVVQIK